MDLTTNNRPRQLESPITKFVIEVRALGWPPRRPARKMKGIAMSSDQRLTMSVAEAAEVLGISRSAAYDCIGTGDLPAVKMGRRWLVPIASLHRLLDSAA